MPCGLRRRRTEGVISVTNKVTSKKIMISLRKKRKRAPPAKGASSKSVSSGEGEDPTLLAKLS